MSDSDSASTSSSDSEDLTTTGLIATRAKRATAGNLYASLRANLDDEELQKELLAEDAEDVGDYEGEDKEGEGEDDEDAMESSSDEDDQGPGKEGDEGDLEGERELRKKERQEQRRKRTVKDAKLKIPGAVGRARKRVRLAEGVKGGDGEDDGQAEGHLAPKPKKKSERSNWLPTPEDGPIRQSGRSLAVANREIIHANLAQSAARSEKQRRVMKDAAERESRKRTKHADLSQEERLRRCERVERETGKELGRFERDEAERQRAREEALAAKRRRGVQGPVVRCWSGSVVWEGERVRVGRVEHGSLGEEELQAVGKKKEVEVAKEDGSGAAEGMDGVVLGATQPTDPSPSIMDGVQQAATDAPVSWLQGIEQYAAQPASTPNAPPPATGAGGTPINGFTPSAPATNAYTAPVPYQTPAGQLPLAVQPLQEPQIYHGWPPGSQSYPLPQHIPPVPISAAAPPPAPAPPLIRKQAQRTLLILEDFPELASAPETTTTTGKPSKRKSLSATTSTTPADHTLDTTPSDLQSLLLPDSYPTLTPTQTAYLVPPKPTRKIRLEPTYVPPTAPPKARCGMTQWEAKFRDPKTGVPYADLHAYKALQRVVSGGCAWSGVLGCWVGSSLGVGRGTVGKGIVGMGRAAKGVPVGFTGDVVGGEGVKVEGGV